MEHPEAVYDLTGKAFRYRPGYPPNSVDAACLFGRAQGDYEHGGGDSGILELAASLYLVSRVRHVVLPAAEGSFTPEGQRVPTGYPGLTEWQKRLQKLSVGSIRHAPDPGPVLCHTRSEGDEFVLLAKHHEWETAVAIANPHQLLRIMLGFLVSFRLVRYRLRVWPLCPKHTAWTKCVYGSQGERELPRYLHIAEEWRRILRYQEQGDLARFEELSEYLTAL